MNVQGPVRSHVIRSQRESSRHCWVIVHVSGHEVLPLKTLSWAWVSAHCMHHMRQMLELCCSAVPESHQTALTCLTADAGPEEARWHILGTEAVIAELGRILAESAMFKRSRNGLRRGGRHTLNTLSKSLLSRACRILPSAWARVSMTLARKRSQPPLLYGPHIPQGQISIAGLKSLAQKASEEA